MEISRGKYLLAAAVFSVVVPFASAAAKGDACTGVGAGSCVGTGLICSTTCVCGPAYKENSSDNATCLSKGLGDTCIADGDCTAGVADSKCSATEPKKCECNTGFTAINNMCKRAGLGDPCTANSDCTAVTDSKCSATDPKKCECNTGFTAINKMCKRGLGDPCTADIDCTAVTDSKCSATDPKKCECNTGFTAINKMCKRDGDVSHVTSNGLGNPCTDETSCSAVCNAECPTATKKCACKANFKEDNGQCSKANGLQTLLSAPVALLLSFLTIVVTRLH